MSNKTIARVKQKGVFFGEYWEGDYMDLMNYANQANAGIGFTILHQLPLTAKKDQTVDEGRIQTYWTPGKHYDEHIGRVRKREATRRVQEHRARRRDEGYREVRVWVPDGKQEQLREYARGLCDGL